MKIRYKLFLAILITAFVSVFALQQAQRYSFEKGLKRYSDISRLERLSPLVLGLSDIYARDGSWDSLRGQLRLPIPEILLRSERQRNRHDGRPRHRRLYAGLTLLDSNKKPIAGAVNAPISATKPIDFEGSIVGYLALSSASRVAREIDRSFSKQQQAGTVWAAGVILIGALFSALLISRSLGRPLKSLVEQVQKLSDGDYNLIFIGEKSDEFMSLSRNLSRLASTLRENRQNRQQWISDISHELRTPVAVLQAEIECIEDGHKALDMDSLLSLKSEVNRLSHLISDLHQLSQADAGVMSLDFSMCDLAGEIENAVAVNTERFAERNISIQIELTDMPLVFGDVFRLRQVVNNLIENTLRYTDAHGVFKVSWRALNDQVELLFEDSSPSVPEPSMAKLFERLYRVDSSRSRATGASGLGLSICHVIIKGHSGTIRADKSDLGGLAIGFSLPCDDKEANV